MIGHPFLLHRYAEYSWLIQFDQVIDRNLHNSIVSLAHELNDIYSGYADIIISYNSLMISWYNHKKKSFFPTHSAVEKMVAGHIVNNTNQSTGSIVEIPVCYDKRLDNDLAMLSTAYAIPEQEIIALHASSVYHVYMLGFLPGFAYMGSVDAKIAFPRKPNASLVKAGSVGIAGEQTGIYPGEGPGGWNIVGHTPFCMFDINKNPASVLAAGQDVRFVPIDYNSYRKMAAS